MQLPMFAAPVDRTDTDERFTPRWIFDALGETFDLDPASPVEAETHVPAARRYTREDDGLAQPWEGFVWCNPGGYTPALSVRAALLGIDWMDMRDEHELAQAIPPAYTQWLGSQLLDALVLEPTGSES